MKSSEKGSGGLRSNQSCYAGLACNWVNHSVITMHKNRQGEKNARISKETWSSTILTIVFACHDTLSAVKKRQYPTSCLLDKGTMKDTTSQ